MQRLGSFFVLGAVLSGAGCGLIPDIEGGKRTGDRHDGGPGGGGGALEPLTSVENEMLGLFNMERSTMGLPALVRDPGLDAIVLDYGREMASQHHLGHIDAAGRESEGRARHFSGDPEVRCSEIVQWWGGTPSGRTHYEGFMNSPPHHMAYLEQGTFSLGPTMHVGVMVIAETGPTGTEFASRDGSYAAAMLCDRPLVLVIDPASE